MSMLDALWLGLVQALTEFLPVSSSGHLRLAHALLGAAAPDDLLFDLLLHVGTLVAVVLVYRRDLAVLVARSRHQNGGGGAPSGQVDPMGVRGSLTPGGGAASMVAGWSLPYARAQR